MATQYTSLLGLALPAQGELSGTWGDTVNNAITSLLDTAVAGTTTLSTDGDVTLTTTTGASNQARQAILLWTATGTVTRNITAPAHSKAYFVINKTGGTQSIVIRGAGPTTGVTVLAGTQSLVVWNGVDFVEVASGNVDGPASSTDNAVARFDGTTGKLIQNSSVTIDDSNNISGVVQLNATTVDATNVEVTNIKAKDGTAAVQIADSTGVVSVTAAPVLTALTASQAVFTNASKALVSNAITGTGNVVMSASPTLTGTITAAAITASSTITGNGNWVLGNADTDTITQSASYVNGTRLRSAKTATNTLALAAYDVDGAAYTDLVTLTASNTPTLALTSTGVGTIDNMSVGATTPSTGAFTTLAASSTITASTLTASQAVFTDGSKGLVSNAITGTGDVVMSTSPTLVTPNLGTPSTLVGTNITGTASGLSIGGTAAVSTTATSTVSSTASAFKVPFLNTTGTATGNFGILHDTEATFTYDPSTNTLVVGTVSGALSGNATTATTLQTARTINGVSFNGSANITVAANTTNTLTLGSYLTGTSFNGSSAVTAAVDATTTNTASKVVARDASGNFAAGTITAALSGNATTATTLQTARTINGTSFNGSANITTANWGTARTLWGQSVNGSANITAPLLPAAGSAAAPAFSTSGDTNTGIYFPAADTIGFVEGGAEVMRIDSSGNVSANVGGYWQLQPSATAAAPTYSFNGDTDTGMFRPAGVANTVAFSTAGSERMRLDSSGNLGLGVTPSAWSAFKAFEIGSAGNSVWSAEANDIRLAANYVYNGGGTYAATGLASQYQQTVGQHRWFTAPSGTAGNAISFSQSMTLDASSNLMVGGTSALQSARITAYGSVAAQNGGVDGTFANAFVGVYSSDSNEHNAIQTAVSSVGTNSGFRFRASDGGGSSGTTTVLDLTRTQTIFYTSGSERARIDSSGNLLVGTTGSGARMRVDSAGTTSGTNIAQFNNSSAVEALRVRSDGAIFTGTSSSGLAACPYNNTTANAANMVVGTGGDLQRSTSSLKYKTDVQNAAHGLAEVMQLRPVTYKGKNDGDKVFGGLIAEEVHAAGLTEFVQYAGDGTPDALAYGQMVSLAFKAIQEQQAIITALTARITALESN